MRFTCIIVIWLEFCLPGFFGDRLAWAQDEPELAVDASEIQAVMNEPALPTEPAVLEPSGIDLLSLLASGGVLMIPIGIMSLLVVMLGVERFLTLRTNKVLPRSLVRDLENLAEEPDQFNPTTAFHLCNENPSPAARVVMTMLMRTGQPLAEAERAATEAAQREADDYAGPIRWLNLSAAATPLMGLLGTVWGMILTFHESTTLSPDRSRSEQLSEGIYIALVTTLAGLVVAIPASLMAQYFENRLSHLFHRIEELAFDVAPGLSRYVGRNRMDATGRLRVIERGATAAAAPPLPPPVIADNDGFATSVKGS